MADQRCLILDIETSPMEVYVWELKDQYVGIHQIKKDWHVMAWAAKWLNDPASKIVYRDQRDAKTISDDKKILTDLWELLDEADVVITQNGKKFDGPKINARMMLHGMKPPTPYRHFDTYQLVRSVAKFTSNKLEYLTDQLNTKYKKLNHSDFPGLSLWLECLAGNIRAWDVMKKYNTHDVLSTEELYNNVRPWAPETMPKPYYDLTTADKRCGTCGNVGKMREGKERKAKTYRYRQHSCLKCGAWQAGERIKS